MAIGGAEGESVLREFVRLAGGVEEARIVVMSAASSEPESQDERYRETFENLGVRDFRILETRSKDDADRPASAGVINRATGVFFTGGDQKRLVRVIRGTKVDEALHRRLGEGLVIAGTSAGASMMSATMLDDGDSEECPRKGIVRLGHGLGFLTGMIIDQHFGQRGRLGRLLASVAEKPDALGIGIGEDTAMIVEGETFRVIGRGVVTVVDGAGEVFNDSCERGRGEPLSLSGIVLHTVGFGHQFHLPSRSLIRPTREEAAG
jgi:cyanophycinase